MRKFHYTSLFVNAIFQARPSNALLKLLSHLNTNQS
jgi:hypothetical protein